MDHLNDLRLSNGAHDPEVLAEVFKNLIPAVKEAAMPYSVSRTEHGYLEMGPLTEAGEGLRTYMWLGKTAVESAVSGYRFHRDPAALKRVDVEVAEAKDAELTLRPGVIKAFISPKMSQQDAPYEVAKREHLGDDDSLRISYCTTDEAGNITGRVVESILVRNIPLDAWVAMLRDTNNIFGKSIAVRDAESALSVMEVFDQLELSPEALPEGVVSLLAAVVPYIQESGVRRDVLKQLELFRGNQEALHTEAESIASRWMEFEKELADSLHLGWATKVVEGFISSHQAQWHEDDLAVIMGHQMAGNQYVMSRKLAAILETAKQNMLWTRAAVATGNEDVIAQIDTQLAEEIYAEEMYWQSIAHEPALQQRMALMNSQTDRRIANENVSVGGGCAGDNEGRFNQFNPDGTPVEASQNTADRKNWKTKIDTCVVEGCPTRPGKVEVGPCGVCMGRCQRLYDSGKDPSKGVSARKVIGESALEKVWKTVFGSQKAEKNESSKKKVKQGEFELAA